jgi:hypothetical protein
MRDVKRVKPAMPPILAMSSAGCLTSLVVESGWESCEESGVSRAKKGESVGNEPINDTAIETLLTDSNDDVLSVALKNLGTRNHETIHMGVWGVSTYHIWGVAGGRAGGPSPEHPNGYNLQCGSGVTTGCSWSWELDPGCSGGCERCNVAVLTINVVASVAILSLQLQAQWQYYKPRTG